MPPEQPFYTKTFRDSRFVIYADGPVEDRRASLSLSFYDGNPRIKVSTGVPGAAGLINFPSSIPDFLGLLVCLKDAASTEFTKLTAESWQPVYVDNKPTKEKKLASTLHVGKTKEGVVYMALVTETHPKIVFYIKPSAFHVFKDKEGNKIDDGHMSKAMTLMLVDLLMECIANVMTRRAEESPGSTPQQGQSKADSAKQTDYKFDDIPF